LHLVPPFNWHTFKKFNKKKLNKATSKKQR